MPTRRDFLAGTVGVVGATALPTSPASAAPVVQTTSTASQRRVLGANDRVRVGVIGTGRQGTGVLRGHQRLSDVEIAAISDVYAPNLAKAAEVAPTAATHADFRRILDDQTIDAVVIATPDHWHALMTVLACQAGKDVYVEKPHVGGDRRRPRHGAGRAQVQPDCPGRHAAALASRTSRRPPRS